MKALVGAFNQEKALVGAFSVIVQPVVEPMEYYTALVLGQVLLPAHQAQAPQRRGGGVRGGHRHQRRHGRRVARHGGAVEEAVLVSAVKRSIGSTTGCTNTEKAPTRAFS